MKHEFKSDHVAKYSGPYSKVPSLGFSWVGWNGNADLLLRSRALAAFESLRCDKILPTCSDLEEPSGWNTQFLHRIITKAVEGGE